MRGEAIDEEAAPGPYCSELRVKTFYVVKDFRERTRGNKQLR